MNRRSLFGLFAALPFAGVAAKDAMASPAPADATKFPLGFVRDVLEVAPGMRGYRSPHVHTLTVAMPAHTHTHTISDPGHTHGYAALSKRQIWDGDKFVDFNSAEGTAVLNRLLTGNR